MLSRMASLLRTPIRSAARTLPHHYDRVLIRQPVIMLPDAGFCESRLRIKPDRVDVASANLQEHPADTPSINPGKNLTHQRRSDSAVHPVRPNRNVCDITFVVGKNRADVPGHFSVLFRCQENRILLRQISGKIFHSPGCGKVRAFDPVHFIEILPAHRPDCNTVHISFPPSRRRFFPRTRAPPVTAGDNPAYAPRQSESALHGNTARRAHRPPPPSGGSHAAGRSGTAQ